MTKAKKIAIVAGGTGGHFFPAAALGNHLDQLGYKVTFYHDKRCQKYVSHTSNYPKKQIYSAGISGIPTWKKLVNLIILGVGFLQTLFAFIINRPNKVIGFGGYTVIPAFFAAIILRIPYMIHEQNAIMGRTNRFFAKYAQHILTGLPLQKPAIDTHWVGMPIRDHIQQYTACPYPEKKDKFHILIVGGSLGAAIFSDLIPKAIMALPHNLQGKIQVTQQCRKEDLQKAEALYNKTNVDYKLYEFIDDMGEYLANAHLVISRAGASAIAEIAAIGRPALLIPYPYAIDDHQTGNAQSILKKENGFQSCWVEQQRDLTEEKLAAFLEDKINQFDQLQEASQLVHSFAKQNSLEEITQLL